MTDVITDTYLFEVEIKQHADLKVKNVQIPEIVESSTPFTISYQVINNGETDTCWGHIVDKKTGYEITNSKWQETIQLGETKTFTFEIPGIGDKFTGAIEVGYYRE